MGWQTKGTDCHTSSSTLLPTPDWSCTMLCKYTALNVIYETVKWAQCENSKYYRMLFATMSVPHLQVSNQTRSPLSGTQSGEQQEMQRWALWEPQVWYTGQHPSVRDMKIYCQNTAETPAAHSGGRTRNQELVRWHKVQRDGTQALHSVNSEEPNAPGSFLQYSTVQNSFIYAPSYFWSRKLWTQKCI